MCSGSVGSTATVVSFWVPAAAVISTLCPMSRAEAEPDPLWPESRLAMDGAIREVGRVVGKMSDGFVSRTGAKPAKSNKELTASVGSFIADSLSCCLQTEQEEPGVMARPTIYG